MSSPPSPRTLEGLIVDTWGAEAVRADVVALLEPYREHVEYLLKDFDEDELSWRDYCGCVYGYDLSDDGALPRAAMAAVDRLLSDGPANP